MIDSFNLKNSKKIGFKFLSTFEIDKNGNMNELLEYLS